MTDYRFFLFRLFANGSDELTPIFCGITFFGKDSLLIAPDVIDITCPAAQPGAVPAFVSDDSEGEHRIAGSDTFENWTDDIFGQHSGSKSHGRRPAGHDDTGLAPLDRH